MEQSSIFKKLKYFPRIHPDFYYGLVLMIVGIGFLIHTLHNRYNLDLDDDHS